ncbi:hypothetical protein QOZ80_6BG0462760 [Eleusine coracana subsp. coracana]|nr:hypothetical protein QOZ80_6BG0462760 [Eleusine coracana subsp. coracana]
MPSSASSSSSLCFLGASAPRLPVVPLDSDTDDDDVTSGGGDDEALLSRPIADRFASSFRTQDSLDALCKKYGVPKEFAPLPAGDFRACSPPPAASICVYAHALEAGMRFPLHPFFCSVLAHFGVAPSQVAPNGWRAMAGFVVLCHFAGVHPPSDAAGALVTGMPLSLKGWKEGFFFLRSPTPWPCSVTWGAPSKSATADPVLGRTEKNMAAKLLRVHGTAVDLKTYLCESNLAAAMIAAAPPTTTPPRSPTTTADDGSKWMDPAVYEMMKRMRAEKASASPEKKVAVKSESPLVSTEKKRKLAAAEEEGVKVKPDPCSPPPGFASSQTQKKPRYAPDRHDGDTADWEAARQLLQGIVTPSRERSFAAARPSDVIASSYFTMLQAANYASFSLGHALELEEKLAARERDADALREQLAKAKAEVAEKKAAAAAETRNSEEHVRMLAEHALGGGGGGVRARPGGHEARRAASVPTPRPGAARRAAGRFAVAARRAAGRHC